MSFDPPFDQSFQYHVRSCPVLTVSWQQPRRTVGYANLVSYVQFHADRECDEKYIKDPIELHNIKQWDGESTKDFVRRYKLERRYVKGTPECMRISRFVHGITNPELIKRLHDKISKTVDEMMSNHIFPPGGGGILESRAKEVVPIIEAARRSASEILYEQCFNRLCPEIKNQLVPAITPLIGFSGDVIWPIGQIQLLVTIGDEEHSASSPYNEIIGMPGVRKKQGVPSTAHGMLKIPVEGGIITLKVACWFHWKEGFSPFKQKKKGQTADRNQAIQEEVRKLIEACIMKEVHYHDWLSNSVMVKNHDSSWRMCVDFKDLYKACPKDGYPLPEIDWKVESCADSLSNASWTHTKAIIKYKWQKRTKKKQRSSQAKISRNLEVYVNDLVIKSCTEDEIVKDIDETLKTLREINMKLNLKKCTFGVEEGMFLRYKVNTKGLKVCPDKVDVVLSLPSPKCLKDVQKLNEKLATLNSNKRDSKCGPNDEKGSKQIPIYLVSRALRDPKLNYTSMEKLVLALVHTSKRLKRYFQAHPIIVVTDQPIQQVLSRPQVAGRLQKWSIELGEYAIHYRPRVSVKRQILADFIVERPEEDSSDTLMEAEEELPEPWILFTDGSSCTDGSGARLILTNPKGVEFTYALRFRFDATNNETEYEALIVGPRIAEQMGVKNLQANVDSRLVANQVNETYVAKEVEMIRYLEKVRTLTNSFNAFSIRQIPRSENKKADALSKIASPSFARLRPLQANYVLREIHEGSCSMHVGSDFPKKLSGTMENSSRMIHSRIGAKNYLRRRNKARLDAKSNNWIEELPRVLWAQRTMIKSSNEDTPFSLTYETEAVILAEIGMPTLRTAKVDLVQNNEALEINLDLLEDRKEEAVIHEAKSKAKIEKYYNSKVLNTSFKLGDIVYYNNDASRVKDTGKLGPKWEGPYEVTEAL
uniref:Uncharacterized protein n=1 Tax=Tanacetum cinerariifolium TaxID=118510 RepID=A0A699GSC3_TANCI|nr:hypothetical protein [Tanacetum cinerariifolium]